LTQKITGVQRYAVEISKQIKKLYPEIKLLAPKNIIQNDLANDLEVETYGNLTGHLWEQVELPSYLRKNRRPFLVNLANTAPLQYEKQIVTIHDISFLVNSAWFSRKFYCYYRLLIPALVKRSVRILTVSEFSKRELMSHLHVPEQKIKVIYNGVSDFFRESDKVTENNIHGKYILAVASLDPRKNLRRLIAAYMKIKKDNIKLVIVGEQNRVFNQQLGVNLSQTGKDIIWLGRVPDEALAVLYKHARLLVLPSLYEGFGLPPLEAMACGCPVVVSNVASLPEVCGDAAYYINPYDTDSIADGIDKVLSNGLQRDSLIAKALKE
jgi:glycosyltransferase involved in cell wall biosynthesis